ncbi:MAG: phosphoenolpyruvate synthase [Anaerolineales bacterium]|nr:phosphoenolpyruvate synthase [Anaerolineales bacterium]
MLFIIYAEHAKPDSKLGGKARHLAALQDTDIAVPAWFVVSVDAFTACLSDTQRRRLSQAIHDPDPLSRFDRLTLPAHIRAELAHALADLCPDGAPVAVRSSALDEDGTRHSFAGQLDSFLNVPHAEVADKVIDVWRSAFSDRVLAYRRANGLNAAPQPPAVLIQRMVNADQSGVAFSADPVTGRRDIAVISAVPGLGTALVSGQTNADTYYVDRQGQIIRQQTADGRPLTAEDDSAAISVTGEANTLTRRPTPYALSTTTLSSVQIQTIAALARRTEQIFGCPQDIEWAIENDQLYLLQARPITTLLAELSPPEGQLNLWDNSNIAESYPGVTTPLTFSFARRAYEEVYRQFCRIMGVPDSVIIDHVMTFRHMLGFIQGRIYYNLLSWYRVLALLPGYKLNRRFMEQMMGVKESLPDELLAEQTPPSRGDRLRDALYLGRTLTGLIANYILLPRRIDAFYDRLNNALGSERPDLKQKRPDELVAYYRNLESQLLTRWDAPLINDFFAMIFYGILRQLAEKWCGDTHGTLQNALLSGAGGIVSAEPAAHIRCMAQLTAGDNKFITLLANGSLAEILSAIPARPAFEAQYNAYLEKFGDRCLEELKLESPTLHDDPLPLLRSVGQLARHLEPPPTSYQNGAHPSPQTTASDLANKQVRASLSGHPWRRLIFNWVLQNARRLIRNRENLRFERTRLFGRARQIFVELGCKLHALNLLADPRDIFYLEVEEIFGFINGVATTTNLNALAQLRHTEFERHQKNPPPPDRFETRGVVSNYQSPPVQPNTNASFPNSQFPTPNPQFSILHSPFSILKGLGCSPGIVRGPVRIITDPKNTILQPGEILVAQRTDPGWIILFSAAAGLLVEHGSLLSHAAIVSREMRLPAIVSLKGVTQWLKDGDLVEFNGSTGEVRKL